VPRTGTSPPAAAVGAAVGAAALEMRAVAEQAKGVLTVQDLDMSAAYLRLRQLERAPGLSITEVARDISRPPGPVCRPGPRSRSVPRATTVPRGNEEGQ
jgi:hypothetical protein